MMNIELGAERIGMSLWEVPAASPPTPTTATSPRRSS
jgi:hypothetical protein